MKRNLLDDTRYNNKTNSNNKMTLSSHTKINN